MLNLNVDALTKLSNNDDKEVEKVITFEDKVEEYKLFATLQSIVNLIFKAEELGINDFGDLYDVLVEDLSEDETEKITFILYKFLQYVKVPNSAIEDLFNEDKEISKAEFENLAELIADRVGENDIDSFIAYAINNPDLVDIEVETDDLQMDWAFYKTEAECKKGTGDRKIPKSKNQVCEFGFNKGIPGYWRYPKGDFPNGDYKLKDGGHREVTHLSETVKVKFTNNKHKRKADAQRKKDQQQRYKMGLSAFKGYIGKRKSTKAPKTNKKASAV